jgi:hypothetical protein
MLDREKPRRPRSEEQAEIHEFVQGRQARFDDETFGLPDNSLAALVARREAEDQARLDARDRAETPEEHEAAERLRREEEETHAEIPFLQAREFQRQAAAAARRVESSEYSRQAS